MNVFALRHSHNNNSGKLVAKIFADIWHISIFADALLPLGWLEEWLITRLMNKQISVPILRTTFTITMQSNRNKHK